MGSSRRSSTRPRPRRRSKRYGGPRVWRCWCHPRLGRRRSRSPSSRFPSRCSCAACTRLSISAGSLWRTGRAGRPISPSAREKTLTLAVEQVPFEVFLRRMHEALDLGGFALAYGPGGAPDRLFVAEKGRGAGMAAPAAPPAPSPPAGWIRATADAGRVSVPFLMRQPEADSMKLGAPGQVIVVESAPFAKTTTSECHGTPGRYPVQTVLVTEAANTYIAGIV